jgi:hypothetical protein
MLAMMAFLILAVAGPLLAVRILENREARGVHPRR